MNKAGLFILAILCTPGFFFCNSKEIRKNVLISRVVLDIANKSLENVINERKRIIKEQLDKLSDIKSFNKDTDGFQIKIHSFTWNSTDDHLFFIENKNGQWQAKQVDFNLALNDNQDTITVAVKGINNLVPQTFWTLLYDSIYTCGLFTLPDINDHSGYSGDMDEDGMIIEYHTK